MRPVQDGSQGCTGRLPGSGGNFKAEMVALNAIFKSAPPNMPAIGITDNTSAKHAFESDPPYSTRERVRRADRTTQNMLEHTKQTRQNLGHSNDEVVWIKAHMTTRCGPINETHDICDNNARSACEKEYLPMPIFPLHEESFVLLDENNHLVEGDPRRTTQRRALTQYFENTFERSKIKGKGTPSAVNYFVKFNGGPHRNNTAAEQVLDSDDNAAIRLMIRARSNCFPTATTLQHRDPLSYDNDHCHACKKANIIASETTIHALASCPSLQPNNDKCIRQITSVLLDIQDPLATTWSKQRPPIITTQETLDRRWPNTFLLTKQPIIYKEEN